MNDPTNPPSAKPWIVGKATHSNNPALRTCDGDLITIVANPLLTEAQNKQHAERIVADHNAIAPIKGDPAVALGKVKEALRYGADCAGRGEAHIFLEALRILEGRV